MGATARPNTTRAISAWRFAFAPAPRMRGASWWICTVRWSIAGAGGRACRSRPLAPTWARTFSWPCIAGLPGLTRRCLTPHSAAGCGLLRTTQSSSGDKNHTHPPEAARPSNAWRKSLLPGTPIRGRLLQRRTNRRRPAAGAGPDSANDRTANLEAFWQTAVLGRAAPDVASELGLTAAAVRQAKSRTLRRLRRNWERRRLRATGGSTASRR